MNQTCLLKKFILLLLVLIPATEAYAHENEIAVFVDNSYAPYMYEVGDSKAGGLYPTLLQEIIREAGFQAEILAVPWKRALLFGERGVGAVGGAYKNAERLERYDYSAPLYEEKMVVFVNKKHPFNFNDIDDLSGKMIGVSRGWSYGEKFDQARDAKLFEVNVRSDASENFKMLALGRIDCLILDQISGESYIETLAISDKIKSLPVPFSLNKSYLIISKSQKMKEFLDAFDASLEKMRESGVYSEIVRAFFQDTTSTQQKNYGMTGQGAQANARKARHPKNAL